MAFSLVRPKESFDFIQVETDTLLSQLFRFNERAYDGVLLKTKSISGDFRALADVAAPLQGYIAEAQKLSGCRIILGFHSGLISTVQTVVTMRRDQAGELIDEAELENLISAALWKIVSRDRSELARKMNMSEASVTLVSALISRVRVDGHKVASPVGFAAHTVEFTILYCATSRHLYDLLSPLLSGEQEVYVTEIGVSELLRLAERRESEPFLLVRISERYTYVYQWADGEARYGDTIAWGKRSLIGALISELMVSEVQAVEIIERADTGLTSVHVRRRIEALLLEEVSVLLKGIGAHAGKQECKGIYISAPFSLPDALFSQAAGRRSGISVPVIPMPSDLHGEKSESALTLDMKTSVSPLALLCANAKVAQQFFTASDINKIVKRRARWIAGASARSTN